MKKKKLSAIGDGVYFALSARRGSAVYKMQTKQGGRYVYTSQRSQRTFTTKKNKVAFTRDRKDC